RKLSVFLLKIRMYVGYILNSSMAEKTRKLKCFFLRVHKDKDGTFFFSKNLHELRELSFFWKPEKCLLNFRSRLFSLLNKNLFRVTHRFAGHFLNLRSIGCR